MTPLPMAASVSATSIAARRDPGRGQQQAEGDEADDRVRSSRRADDVDRERQETSDEARDRGPSSCGRLVAIRRAPAISWLAVAAESCTSSQTQTSFSAASDARRLRQQAEHDQPEAEIVGFGQRVKAAQRIGETQQAERAGEEEERPAADQHEA